VRSPGEIWFRLRQEFANAAAFVIPPDLPAGIGEVPRPAIFPDPDSFVSQLRESDFAREIEDAAGMIRSHRFPLLGAVVETGPDIRWRRDCIRGIESGTGYFRTIPYLDTARVGDHKLIWELNRHQHLIVLAQAFRFTGRGEFLDDIPPQIDGWWAQNPWLRGINWASALEVAFRALSWIWVDHLAGAALDADFRRRLLRGLYRHGLYLERNLSIYFAPNTHLLGEAVVLHALGSIYPEWPRAARWKQLGGRLVKQQMDRQVRDDGSHFEQSSYYHVYALDLFLLHALLDPGVSPEFRQKIRRMADYLAALSSGDGVIPFLGDDDGGNLFHPYGDRRRFGAATLATCGVYFGTDEWPCERGDIAVQAAWWMGRQAFTERQGDSRPAGGPRLFEAAGVAVLSRTPVHIVADTRGFGHAGAGHSHAHALSVVCRKEDRDILVDPGTFTYTGDPAWRSRFRGTAFHNTVRVDRLDQAEDGGPFRWLNKPETTILNWTPGHEFTCLRAVCAYRGIDHERQIVWIPESRLLAVVDTVRGRVEDAEPHLIEQFWHCGGAVACHSPGVWRINDAAILTFPASSNAREFSGGEYGWESSAPGQRDPSPVIIVERTAKLPVMLAAVLAFGLVRPPALGVEVSDNKIRLLLDTGRSITFSAGLPTIEMSV
jgi:Heparinase II/III-like protein/Heparinase II/III N-terminus